MFKRIVKGAIWFVLGLGIIKGLVRYNESSGHGLAVLVESLVNGIADITYRWFPQMLEIIDRAFS